MCNRWRLRLTLSDNVPAHLVFVCQWWGIRQHPIAFDRDRLRRFSPEVNVVYHHGGTHASHCHENQSMVRRKTSNCERLHPTTRQVLKVFADEQGRASYKTLHRVPAGKEVPMPPSNFFAQPCLGWPLVPRVFALSLTHAPGDERVR